MKLVFMQGAQTALPVGSHWSPSNIRGSRDPSQKLPVSITPFLFTCKLDSTSVSVFQQSTTNPVLSNSANIISYGSVGLEPDMGLMD